jgi:thioredoxin 1
MTDKKEKIVHVGTKEEFDNLIAGKNPVLVDFFAVWCGPCQMMGPILDEMIEKYKNIDKVKIAKVDIDEIKEIAIEYGVMSVPTFIIFQEGKAIETMVGMRSGEELQAKLDDLLKK